MNGELWESKKMPLNMLEFWTLWHMVGLPIPCLRLCWNQEVFWKVVSLLLVLTDLSLKYFVQYFKHPSFCQQNDCHRKCRAHVFLFSEWLWATKHWKELNLRKELVKRISKLPRRLSQKKCLFSLITLSETYV